MKSRKLLTGLLLSAGVASAVTGSQAIATATVQEVDAATTDVTGWKKVGGQWRYLKKGKAYTGWHYMGKAEGEKVAHWSYFDKNGNLYTGWHYMGKAEGEKTPHWSYFGGNGWLRTGWQQMGKGTSNPDGNNAKHWSYFGANGWLRTGWQQMGKGTSNPDGNNAKHWSYFGGNGWLRTGWQELGKGTSNPDGNNTKHTSYFGNNGWLVTGTQKISGTTYKFGGNGWLIEKVVENKTQNASNVDTSGWASGKASAYGGSTDPGCGSTTATGAKVTESSLGVAIPMAWGRRDLLGHKVMISYGNKIVTATINDVGGMGGGSRALDLQPGVFRAFGFNSCNSWGVRTVKYKIL